MGRFVAHVPIAKRGPPAAFDMSRSLSCVWQSIHKGRVRDLSKTLPLSRFAVPERPGDQRREAGAVPDITATEV